LSGGMRSRSVSMDLRSFYMLIPMNREKHATYFTLGFESVLFFERLILAVGLCQIQICQEPRHLGTNIGIHADEGIGHDIFTESQRG
jgi:hypothetical protein